MTEPRASLYHRHRFPAEIIAEAVWLYFRFPLSFRMVEDMLAYRGIIVTRKTVREWAEKFGRDYTNKIRRRTPRLGDKWHLDEVVITIKGVVTLSFSGRKDQGLVDIHAKQAAIFHASKASRRW